VATDATAADIADLAVVARAVSPAVLSSDTARYVNAAFELFLGRPATADEVAYWYDRLGRGGGRQPLTLELARSDEWAGARIEAMYADVLGRPADQEGRQFWVERVRAGMPLRDVGAVFYGSSEYYLAAPSPADYVTRLYQALLGRDPDAGGLRYWTGELESGRAKPVDIAAGFYASPESRRRRVAGLYQSVLGRPPEAGGSSYWAQRLLETDDVVLAAELAASDEFHAMAVG
jgi:hypothetical protein